LHCSAQGDLVNLRFGSFCSKHGYIVPAHWPHAEWTQTPAKNSNLAMVGGSLTLQIGVRKHYCASLVFRRFQGGALIFTHKAFWAPGLCPLT